MTKSSQAFRTIREVAEWLGVAAHVLRFWESKFPQIKPVKRAGGRRYYRPADMELVGGIKVLLHDRGLTIRGVQRMLREGGISAVTALSPPLDLAPALEGDLATDWAADAQQVMPPPLLHAEEATADEAPPPTPGPCMQTALARLAAHVADQTSLGPDRRMRLAKALSTLHAQMRAQAPA